MDVACWPKRLCTGVSPAFRLCLNWNDRVGGVDRFTPIPASGMHRGDLHVLVVLVNSFRYGGPRLFTGDFFCALSLVRSTTIRRKTLLDLDHGPLERDRTRFSRAP
jgi:hypothetical protein